MSAATHITPYITPEITDKSKTKSVLRPNPEVLHYLLKTFANYQAAAEMDFANLRHIQTSNLTPM